MRIYLPATSRDLTADEITPRRAYAATAGLARALPEEDEEGLEVSASLCAADASVLLLAEIDATSDADEKAVAPRRVVVAADVDPDAVTEVEPGGEVLPGTVEVHAPVSWEDVAALLVDEPAAQADVRAAARGDEDAFERAAEADLLWFDVSERAAVTAELAADGRS